MARNVTINKTASIANTDLEMHLDFVDPADPEAPVLDDMKARLSILYDDGSRGTAPRVKVSDVLDNVATVTSGTKLTNFRAALVELRDAGFDAAGILDV